MLFACDPSPICLSNSTQATEIPQYQLQVDEEWLPFCDNSLDLVFSNLSLHWINRLPETFKDVQRCLRPDGVFIGCMFGGHTLLELRASLQLAEMERQG